MKERKNILFLSIFSSIIFLITVTFSIILNIDLFSAINTEQKAVLIITLFPLSLYSLIIGSGINLINSILVSILATRNQIWFTWIMCLIEILLIGVQFLILYI